MERVQATVVGTMTTPRSVQALSVVLSLLLVVSPVVGFVGLSEAQSNNDPEPTANGSDTPIEYPDEVTLGKSFTITVEGKNEGGRGGHYSTISMSFPSLEESDDNEQLRIESQDFDTNGYKLVKTAGDAVIDKQNNQITAEYALAEAGTNGSGYWVGGKEHELSVEVTPEETGTFVTYVRVTMSDDDDQAEKHNWPASSSYTDQQDFKVYRIETEVVPPKRDLEVDVEHQNGNDADEVNAILLYRDGNTATPYREVTNWYDDDGDLVDLPHVFEDLPTGHEYKAEVYINDQLAETVDWFSLQRDGASREVQVTVDDPVWIRPRVLFKNGETPLDGATVKVWSHEKAQQDEDGAPARVWRSGNTNADGYVNVPNGDGKLWLYPTSAESPGYYIIEVLNDGERVHRKRIDDLTSSRELDVVTGEELQSKAIVQFDWTSGASSTRERGIGTTFAFNWTRNYVDGGHTELVVGAGPGLADATGYATTIVGTDWNAPATATYQISTTYSLNGRVMQRHSPWQVGLASSGARASVRSRLTVFDLTDGEPVENATVTDWSAVTPTWKELAAKEISILLGQAVGSVTGSVAKSVAAEYTSSAGAKMAAQIAGDTAADLAISKAVSELFKSNIAHSFSGSKRQIQVTFDAERGHRYSLAYTTRSYVFATGIIAGAAVSNVSLDATVNRMVVSGGEVDTTPPTLTLTKRPQRVTDSSSFSVGFELSDDTASTEDLEYAYRILETSSMESPDWSAWNDVGASGMISRTFELDEGEYLIQIQARDPADNVQRDLISFPVTVDKTPPTVSLQTTPAASEGVNVSVIPSENTLARIELEYRDVEGTWTDLTTLTDDNRTRFTRHGQFKIRARATDRAGNTGPWAAINVSTGAVPTARISAPPTTANVGQVVVFEASQSSDSDSSITSYEWDVDGDGTTDINTVSPETTYTYEDPGSYTVELTVTDSNGRTDTDTATIDVIAAPTADAGGPYFITEDGTVDLDASGSTDPDGTIQDVSWELTNGPGSIADGTYRAPPDIDSDTQATVTLTVTDDSGVTDRDTTTVRIADKSPGDVSVKLSPRSQTVKADNTTAYDIVVEGATEGIAGYDLTLALSDPTVATFESYEHNHDPKSHDEKVTETKIDASAGFVDVLGGDRRIVVGTVTVAGKEGGQANIRIVDDPDPIGVIDRDSDHYDIDTTDGGSLTVKSRVDPRSGVFVRQVTRPEFPEVTVYATVRNATGGPITGLTADDFSVVENGTAQTIKSVSPAETAGDSAVSAALVVDRSGSMDGEKLIDSKDAANQFIRQLGPTDEAEVIAFNENVEYKQRWTTDRRPLTTAIDGLRADGDTALWRATIDGIQDAESRVGRSAVIVLSDGKNNRWPEDVDEAIDAAQTAGVPVYTIGLGSSVSDENLTRLATETGGSYYKSPTSAELAEIYDEISRSITTEYKITYRTSKTATDGTDRRVELTAYDGKVIGSDTGTYEAPCAPLPTANFDHTPPSPGEGQQVKFDGTRSAPNGGSIAGYEWDFDNDGIVDAAGRTATHTYASAGIYRAKLTVEKSCGATDVRIRKITVSPDNETVKQQPFGGSPATIPGRIQAQNFDTGGEGDAYHDTSVGNEYATSYRNGSVDIRKTRDLSGEYNIGYFDAGDWLEYTVSSKPGTYDLRLRVATARTDRKLRLSLDGEILRIVDIPNTGGWRNWETVTVENVSVDTNGTQVLRVEPVGSGVDLNWIEFEDGGTNDSRRQQGPYGGTVRDLTGRIQAQHYDTGGEGVAYHDTSAGNEYDTDFRRGDDVDLRETRDQLGEYNVGYFQQDEWLEYTVDATSKTYDVQLRVATPRDGRRLRVSLGGETLRTVDIPNTGGWTNWETVTVEDVSVDADSKEVLRVRALNSGIDFNWITFEKSEGSSTNDSSRRIQPNSKISGQLQKASDSEWIELPVTAGDVVDFTFEKPAGNGIYAYILYPDNPGTADIETTLGGTGQSVSHDKRTITENGTVTIAIGRGDGTGEWTLTNDLQHEVDKWIGGYDGLFRARHERISAGETLSGAIQTPDEVDPLSLPVDNGDEVNITFEKQAGKRISAEITYPNGRETVLAGTAQAVLTARRTITEDGTVEIDIRGEETGEWTLRIDETTDVQQPFGGTPAPLTSRIQAQDFDTGGEGVAYHDTTDQNRYETSYRDTGVDIRKTQDNSGEYNIGYFEEDEWLEYTVDSSQGTYDIKLRVATSRDARRLRLSLGNGVVETVDVPNTGGWRDWQTVTVEDVSVDADGIRTLRIEALNSGIDLNWVEFEKAESDDSTSQQPYGGDVRNLTSRIQAQNFDTGGEGVAYHDTTDRNQYDTSYRDTAVDIRKTQDNSGEYNIGYFQKGEWVEYTVDSTQGTYDIKLRVATARDDRKLRLSLGGQTLRTVDVPNTGGWRDWQTITVENVSVDANGQHVLRVEAENSGIDFNWVSVTP